MKKELENLDNKYLAQETQAKNEITAEKAKLDENIKVANEWIDNPKVVTETLENELKIAEEMKGYINEYDRMIEKQSGETKHRKPG